MFGISDLKTEFKMTATEIECPVRGCESKVRRRKQGDPLKTGDFLCKSCGIYIYPSTFEYANESKNSLWNDGSDLDLLARIKERKAEIQRLRRERSEDAVSWNVFRYFDRSGNLGPLLSYLTADKPDSKCEVIYWSYSAEDSNPWQFLLQARTEFGEATSLEEAALGKRVSEPDIILLTKRLLIFVEAKFGASNKTSGSPGRIQERIDNPKKYLSGGNGWFRHVFKSPLATVIQDQKYELLRFWLLGSWIAEKLGKRFVLANLVRANEELEIEQEFGKHIQQHDGRRFVRRTWESLFSLLDSEDQDAVCLRKYLVQKTIGFVEDKTTGLARPRKAFSLV